MTTPSEMRDREAFFKDIEEREGFKFTPQIPLKEEEVREFLEYINEVEIRRIERRIFKESMERRERKFRNNKIVLNAWFALIIIQFLIFMASAVYVLLFI